VTLATWDAARLTVGGVLAGVDAVLDGTVAGALVHARPAGHHAEPDRAYASTYLNSVACGAEHALTRGLQRVAIVDRYVHAGNGAERIFRNPFCLLAVLEGLAGTSGGIPDPWLAAPTVRAAGAPADARVHAALAAVRAAQPRWF